MFSQLFYSNNFKNFREFFRSFSFFSVVLLYIRSVYEKDGKTRPKPQYNYCDDFRKKIKQYENTIREDLATQFYQNISGDLKELR